MEFPTHEETAKRVAETALDDFEYQGKTIREWMKIITSEDAISRQAVLDMIQMRIGGKELYKAVYDLPPVTLQPKTGQWIYTGDYITEGMLKCSECGFEHDVSERFSYCPNCGIKMKNEIDEFDNLDSMLENLWNAGIEVEK